MSRRTQNPESSLVKSTFRPTRDRQCNLQDRKSLLFANLSVGDLEASYVEDHEYSCFGCGIMFVLAILARSLTA